MHTIITTFSQLPCQAIPPVLHTISPVLTYTHKGSEASSTVACEDQDCKAIQNCEVPFGLRSSEG